MLLAAMLLVAGAVHTVTFDELPDADYYLLHWKTWAANPHWVHAPQVCEGSPCRVWLRRPAPGNVVYVNVTAKGGSG